MLRPTALIKPKPPLRVLVVLPLERVVTHLNPGGGEGVLIYLLEENPLMSHGLKQHMLPSEPVGGELARDNRARDTHLLALWAGWETL